MSGLSEIYQRLFGNTKLFGGNVIDLSEHGRAGGVSTGTPFKTVRNVEEKTLIDEPDANTTYIGRSRQGGDTSLEQWQIKKITVSGTVTTIAYASGDDNYDKEWDERANYSYS